MSYPDELKFDEQAAVDQVSLGIKSALRKPLNRRGLVIAISGGIDSSVSAALSVQAIGADRVFGILMPEEDSNQTSLNRGKMLAEHLGINYEVKNLTPALEAIGCYEARDDAIRQVYPEYTNEWKNKIVISGGLEGKVNHFNIVVEDTAGNQFSDRLPLSSYLTIVAATNYKQRLRKTVEYFHADRLNYAVVGTPNRLEYDQGFFVKNGDGSADVKPIAHLYKSQVYRLASYLGLPEEICNATPTTDTYSLEQGQDEFYFALPYHEMDLALWYLNQGHDAAKLAKRLDLTEAQAELIYRDITKKRLTSRYLHAQPVLMDDVFEIHDEQH